MRTPTVITSMLVVFLVGAVAALGGVSQPIAFNHRLHVQEVGLDCTDCHLHALDGARATIPNIEVCADCHEESLTESVEEARAVQHIQDGVPIPWRKVYYVPDHVYFSHRRHTAIAGIDCERCHGDMEEREQPVIRPLVSLKMDDCMHCHRETRASNDCVLCHR